MWIYSLWRNRSRIEFTFDFTDTMHFECFTNESKSTIFLHVPVLVENRSGLPISITRVVLVDENGNTYRTDFYSSFSSHFVQPLIDSDGSYEKIIHTAEFPIDICSFGARYEILSFSFPANCYYQISKVQIYTNRKTFVKIDQLERINQEILSRKISDCRAIIRTASGNAQWGYGGVICQDLQKPAKK